jgi:hypothetical protein
MQVRGTMAIYMKDIENEKKTKELFVMVSAAMHV